MGVLIFFGVIAGLIALAIFTGNMADIRNNRKLKEETERIQKQIQEERKKLEEDIQRNTALLENIDTIRSEPFDKSSSWLAKMISDCIDMADQNLEDYLIYKPRPAITAAEQVSEIRKKKNAAILKCKQLEYQLLLYESLFPWLPDYCTVTKDDVEQMVAQSETNTSSDTEQDEYETLRRWLSPDEYSRLSTCEKYQLALDRYKNRQKSKWEVGIEYERYVGYLYEQQGYTVEYSGALKKLEDMGRDLIARKGREILVVQCKRWAQEKLIHEKHIFQLYGTCVLFAREYPNNTVIPVFYTSAMLSETARYCAEKMGVELHENCEYEDYPVIKCNVSKSGEKIYHLPFDMQYDRIIMAGKNRKLYVQTVSEAESLGFRRARRYRFYAQAGA